MESIADRCWGQTGDPPSCCPCVLISTLQAAAERSKTVILVKNLPAGTLVAELQETFGRFGSLGRVLLPEGGITAIVEFLEPLEARKAFRHLAYSKVGLLGACSEEGQGGRLLAGSLSADLAGALLCTNQPSLTWSKYDPTPENTSGQEHVRGLL